MRLDQVERDELNVAIAAVEAAGIKLWYPHCVECPLFCGCYYQWEELQPTPMFIEPACDEGPAAGGFWSNK